jgi:hypothetical protein
VGSWEANPGSFVSSPRRGRKRPGAFEERALGIDHAPDRTTVPQLSRLVSQTHTVSSWSTRRATPSPFAPGPRENARDGGLGGYGLSSAADPSAAANARSYAARIAPRCRSWSARSAATTASSEPL